MQRQMVQELFYEEKMKNINFQLMVGQKGQKITWLHWCAEI
jgi:hypothetical protein